MRMSPAPRAHSASLQRRIEQHTLELARDPAIQEARSDGEALLRAAIPDADPASLERLPTISEEITLNALVGLADGRTGEAGRESGRVASIARRRSLYWR